MEILLEQAIKNLKYMCNHSNLEHDRESLRTVIKFVESYDERLKDDVVAMLEEFDLELSEYEDADLIRVEYIRQDIQEKIDKLKEGDK